MDEYNGVNVIQRNAETLRVFEEQFGPIPHVHEIKWNTFGFEVDNKEVVGMGHYGMELTYLPESIGELQNLNVLHLPYNQLTSLPESFGNLKKHHILNIGGNNLKETKDGEIALKKLKQRG